MFILLFIMIYKSKAQQYIELSAAIDTAIKNNFEIKNSQLMVDYKIALLKSGYEIPKTTINSEFGQINSIYFDNKFTINQSMLFPSIYKNTRSVNSNKVEFENLNLKLKDREIRQIVTTKFYEIIQLQLLEKLLIQSDSIYNEVYLKTKIKYNLGENNLVELKNTENQKNLISMQILQLKNHLELVLMEFQILINSKSLYVPKIESAKFEFVDQDSLNVFNHPRLMLKSNESQLTKLELKLEKSKLYPDLNLAYTNMSIQGTGADNVYYNKNSRFQSGQIGVSIPLFYSSQKSVINSIKVKEEIVENELNFERKKLELEYVQNKQKLMFLMKELNQYEDIIMVNSKEIIQSVTLQFKKGEIDYFQWSVWVNQNIALQSEYYNKLKIYNEEAIRYHYLINDK